MSWPWWPSGSAPVAPTVEQPVVGDAWVSPATDHFAGDRHGGSADLASWPASRVELFFASEWYRDPTDLAAAHQLRVAAGSASRAAAVLRQVHRVAEAERIYARMKGGTL